MSTSAQHDNLLFKIQRYFTKLFKILLSFKRYIKLDIILAVLFIISMISPTISAFTRTKFGYPVIFLLYIAWFISCLIRHHRKGQKFLIDKSRIAEVSSMIVWLVVISTYYLSGSGENGYWAIVYTIMFMTVYMIDYMYCLYNERNVLSALVFITLAVYALHSLLSILMLHNQPFLARYFNAYFYEDVAFYAPFEFRGLGSYSFFTALAMSIPVFAYLVAKTKHRVIAVIMYLLCIAGCFYSAYAGVIMLVMLSLLILLVYTLIFYKNKKRKRVLLVILLLSVVLIVSLFSWILPHLTNEMYKAKIRDLLTATLDIEPLPTPVPGEGDEKGQFEKPIYNENSRWEYYQVSIDTIKNKPFFGVGPYFKTKTVENGIGGHSSWLDYLAMYGFVGCMPLMMFFFFYFRRSMKMSSFTLNKVMRLIPWAMFMGYGLLNPVLTARNFPVFLMLLTAGALPSGILVEFKSIFKTKKDLSSKI